MIKGLDLWVTQNNMEPEPEPVCSQLGRSIVNKQAQFLLANQPPMMYRAQIQGRCNLQFAGDNKDLERWKKEWALPQADGKPSYQYEYGRLDSDRSNDLIHSIRIDFPYRVFSNSGQDSVLRPVLSVYGVPFIPGSSVKGIFKRLGISKPESSADRKTIKTYCGTEETPGILRFHGAYPLGDWTNRMVDIVHPQIDRQVKNNNPTSASTLISFYKPQFIFEFSSAESSINWQDVDRFLYEALACGLGGKTSTGYGFLSILDYANPQNSEQYDRSLHVSFKGIGVSSTLLNRQPEFRPNMFKAALRSHMMRLLSGVCDSGAVVEQHVNRLLGSTNKEGVIKLFWESKDLDGIEAQSNVYTQDGILHIAVDLQAGNNKDLEFVGKVLQFAYVMGGFGKSWRRVWHEQFMPKYQKFPIGCHWELKSDWVNFQETTTVSSKDTLATFLNNLYTFCQNSLSSHPPAPVATWREAWSHNRVTVYASSKLVTQSQAVKLFHQEPYKITPAIGGRERPGAPRFVSSVWHRMLPVGNQYLEIVTIFHGDRDPWKGQLLSFTQELKQKGLTLTWGTEPNGAEKRIVISKRV